MRVAVVGAGIMGASCARWLAEAGHETTLFDAHQPGHVLGSSHGGQKIVRQAYPDPFHTALLLEAHPLWRELEEASGLDLYHEVGLAYIAATSSGQTREMATILGLLGVPYQEVAALPSPMSLSADETAILTPEAGWVSTVQALTGTLMLARRAGTSFVHQKVETVRELDDFDLRVFATGAWAGRLLGLRLVPTLQTSAYIRGRYEGPVWIEGFGPELYGFPNEPGSDAFKIGFHATGPEANLESTVRPVQNDQLATLVELAKQRFMIQEPEVASAFSCIYTRTRDERFRIGFLEPGTIVVSACSGHGYKFAPWIGRLVSRMATGEVQPPPEFAITEADRISS